VSASLHYIATKRKVSILSIVKQRIYIDTSIVGGFFDKEFAEPTKALFERLEKKEVVFVIH
jgi:hypothetical protein